MIFNVHIYREMRLLFGGIEADSHEAAAAIARDKPTGDADDIDDCDGETFYAVDVRGDDEYEQSRWIDFEPERERKAAPKLLAALHDAETFISGFEDDECQEGINERLAGIRAALAGASASGIAREPGAARLLGALQAVLPYAWSEYASLRECWKRDDDPAVKEELDACDRALVQASAAIERTKTVSLPPAPATHDTPAVTMHESARFEIEHNPEENPDRVYVMVDGKFDVAIIRTAEGVVIDVYPAHGFQTIATTYAFDSDAGDPEGDAPESGAPGGDHE
jgi:hypothetical protein